MGVYLCILIIAISATFASCAYNSATLASSEDDVYNSVTSLSTGGNSETRKNVLFLIADDLRPELGCYDGEDATSSVHPKMHTPNLDKLASTSLLLKRAYVQEAICSPSRTSFLTGRRPDTTQVYMMGQYFRKRGGDFTTLPQYFKQHGYLTAGVGKVFHQGTSSPGDDPPSWTEPYYHAPNWDLWHFWGSTEDAPSWMAVPNSIQKELPLPDQQVANKAVKRLTTFAKNKDKPFFLAVGFHKPHLPFVFPAKFLKYYPIEAVQLPPNPYAPDGMPPIAWRNYAHACIGQFSDLKYSHYTGNYNTSIANSTVLDLRRAYYSSVSYIDSLVGKLLNKLDQLGLAENTIVSFLGDHGWQLGEHGAWCKSTNFELGTRIPMMVRVPGKTDHGIETNKLTEAVDLYPTIVEAAGLPPIPICPQGKSTDTKLCREGTSLMPLITDPTSPWKAAAFSQYPRPHESNPDFMGYSMRTDQFRYTEWVKFRGAPHYRPNWNKLIGVELYDHANDPEENKNQADNPEYKDTVAELSKLLHSGWRNVPLQ